MSATTPKRVTHMKIDTFAHFLYGCPTSAHVQCSLHLFLNLSVFINVILEKALDLNYSIVQVKIEEKTF